jgi:uncharacterized protein (TIGR03435 family)
MSFRNRSVLRTTALAISMIGAPVLLAQGVRTPDLKFEVASVKLSRFQAGSMAPGERGSGGGCPLRVKIDAGRADFECSTLRMLIGYAYRISPDRVTGPQWMTGAGAPRFDISAKLPQGAHKDRVPELIQTLLADRFKLTVHRATTMGAVYGLVVAKGGLRLERSVEGGSVAPDTDAITGTTDFYGELQSNTAPSVDGKGSTTTISNPRMGTVRETGDPRQVLRWDAPSTSLGGLADLLDNVAPLSAPIIDMTGLGGRYRIILQVSSRSYIGVDPADMESLTLKAFNDGLQKLGLKLESRKGSLQVVAVDSVERKPTDN